MKYPSVRLLAVVVASGVLAGAILLQQTAYAAPFGRGVYGADVPYGSLTSIGISLSPNDVTIPIIPTSGGAVGSSSHTITVTSLDVVGYQLFLQATAATGMSNGTDTIPVTTNAAPSALSVNTWGYNTTSSTSQFARVQTTPTLLRQSVGPFKNGQPTAVTYGAHVSTAKSAGTYVVNITYTAIGQT